MCLCLIRNGPYRGGGEDLRRERQCMARLCEAWEPVCNLEELALGRRIDKLVIKTEGSGANECESLLVLYHSNAFWFCFYLFKIALTMVSRVFLKL